MKKRVKYNLDDNKLYFFGYMPYLGILSLSLFFFFLHKNKETMKVIWNPVRKTDAWGLLTPLFGHLTA